METWTTYVNIPPELGDCHTEPAWGYARETPFHIVCDTMFEDDDTPLYYWLKYYDTKQKIAVTLHQGEYTNWSTTPLIYINPTALHYIYHYIF